jgi:hypothetical protein
MHASFKRLTAAIMLPSLATLLSRTLVAYVDSLMSRSGCSRPTHAPARWRSGTVLKSPTVQHNVTKNVTRFAADQQVRTQPRHTRASQVAIRHCVEITYGATECNTNVTRCAADEQVRAQPRHTRASQVAIWHCVEVPCGSGIWRRKCRIFCAVSLRIGYEDDAAVQGRQQAPLQQSQGEMYSTGGAQSPDQSSQGRSRAERRQPGGDPALC